MNEGFEAWRQFVITKTGVTVLGDGGYAGQSVPHSEQRKDRELDTDARGSRRDQENTTVH